MNALWVRDDRNYDYPICLVHLLDFTIKLTWTFATLKNNDHMVMCGRSFLNSVKKSNFADTFTLRYMSSMTWLGLGSHLNNSYSKSEDMDSASTSLSVAMVSPVVAAFTHR